MDYVLYFQSVIPGDVYERNEQLFVFRQIDLPLVTLRRLIEQPAVSSPIRLRTFVADRVALCHVHSRLKATSARNPVLVKIKTMPFS